MFNVLFDRINVFADSWTQWMLTATIDAAFVLLIVAVIWLLIRRRVVPQVGIFLFLLVPLKLLIPIPVSAPDSVAAWTPSSMVAKAVFDSGEPTELRPPTFSSPAQSNQKPSQPTPAADAHSEKTQNESSVGISPAPAAVSEPLSEIAEAGSPHNSLSSLVPVWETVSSVKASAWLMLGWLSVFSFLALRFIFNEFRFRKRLRSATEVSSDDLPFDFENLCQIAGVRRPVRLIVSNAVSAPAVHGILKPSIILNEQTTSRLSSEQLRWALLHELAHIRRYDLLVILFQRVVSWLFFFHPAVWIANRVVHQQREYACDDHAIIQNGVQSTAAGDAFVQILRTANGVPTRQTMALSVLGMGPREGCQNRLMRMLDTDRTIATRPGWFSLCSVLLIAALTLPQFAAANQDTASEDASDAKQPWLFELQVNDMQGNPVPNALVGVRRNLKDFGELKIGTHLGKAKHRMEYRCDQQGRFVVEFKKRPDGLQLLIEHDRYAPYLANWARRNDASQIPHKFTANLGQAWVIGGQVVDDAGMPVEDAEVRLSIEFKMRPGDHSQWGTGDRLRTDADGKWIFQRVPNSNNFVSVEIEHPSFSPHTTQLARAQFEVDPNNDTKPMGRIQLSPGLSISGTVSNEKGEPISDASLKIRFVNVTREAKTDAAGRYTITGCESAEEKIVVSAPGMGIERRKITIRQNERDIDFKLKPSKGIRIRVVDEEGNPIPKWKVFFQQWQDEHAYNVFDDVDRHADENGVWEWKEAPLGVITADICPPQDRMQLGDVKLVAGEQEYVFTPPKKLFVSGTVTDATTGETVDSFRVVPGLQRIGERRRWSNRDVLNATGGRYRINPSGKTYKSHFVRIEADGYKPVDSREIESDEGEITLDFKLESAGNIVSQVVDPQGNPLADAVVALCMQGTTVEISNGKLENGVSNLRRTRTDADGKFEFVSGLEPFHLFVLHDRGFAHLKPSEMLNDEMDFSIPNKIKLTQWSVLEGTHFVGTEAKSGSQIELTAKEMDFQYNGDRFFLVIRSRTATDAMGKFRFSHVFPGKNSVAHDVNSRTIDASSSVRVSYSAAPGKTKRIRLGGNGTTVTGRLLRPDEAQDYAWKRIWIRMEEVQPNRAVAIPRVLGPNGLFNRAPLPVRVEKKTMRSFYAHPDTEGRFRIEDVPEGDWHFTAGSGDLKIRANTISVTITPDDIAAGDAGEEKELGDIPTAVKE